MKGHEPIIRARKRGWKPTMITIRYDMPVCPPLWKGDNPLDRMAEGLPPDVYVEKGEITDMRFVKGCKVIFRALGSTDEGNRVVKRILENEPRLLVYDAGDDLGIWEHGRWNF